MKILRSSKGKKEKQVTTECRKCDCKFRFAASEAKFVGDRRDGDAYVVRCPECKYENWIAASLFN
jgi:RNase P subunit RPR2